MLKIETVAATLGSALLGGAIGDLLGGYVFAGAGCLSVAYLLFKAVAVRGER